MRFMVITVDRDLSQDEAARIYKEEMNKTTDWLVLIFRMGEDWRFMFDFTMSSWWLGEIAAFFRDRAEVENLFRKDI